jgi:hypothetical protein
MESYSKGREASIWKDVIMAPARFCPGVHSDKTKKTSKVSINVILRRVRISIVAVEKQYVLQILDVCL